MTSVNELIKKWDDQWSTKLHELTKFRANETREKNTLDATCSNPLRQP